MTTNIGIETVYAGITFRSRNEARWAAFFDELGWKWEYEPFDADLYLPDFLLIGRDPVLVECKPDATTDDLGQYVERTTEAVDGIWTHDILIVGSTPFPYYDGLDLMTGPALGLLLEYWPDHPDNLPSPWVTNQAMWMRCTYGEGSNQICSCPGEVQRPCGMTTFRSELFMWRSRICGHGDGDHFLGEANTLAIQIKWRRAADKVRWAP